MALTLGNCVAIAAAKLRKIIRSGKFYLNKNVESFPFWKTFNVKNIAKMLKFSISCLCFG